MAARALLALVLIAAAQGGAGLARRDGGARSLHGAVTPRPGLAQPDYSIYMKACVRAQGSDSRLV
jgi:hypothetical protein